MQSSHLLIFRLLVIVLSLALVAVRFVHHHQKGQTTVFLVCEIGLAIILALAAVSFGYLW